MEWVDAEEFRECGGGERLDHYSKCSWAKQIKHIFPEGKTQGCGESWKPYEN